MMRLWARDEDDAAVVSALLQDACVRPADVHYDSRARRIVVMVHRYCWECDEPRRVPAAIRIESVLKAERRGWPTAASPALDLLAVLVEAERVTLTFAGGIEIRAAVECIDLIVEDIGDTHPAASVPQHQG